MKSCINRKKFFVLSVCMAVLSITTQVANCETYGGGKGTAEKPFLIYTAEQMNTIGLHKEDWDKHFKLMADIDLGIFTGTEFNIIGYNYNKSFKGTFDGNGHKILNFSYSCTDGWDLGIFGYVDSPNAIIKDLTLISPNIIVEEGGNIGSLIGYLRDGTVKNCFVINGNITALLQLGNLVGNIYLGKIFNCGAINCKITGEYGDIGGLVGHISSLAGPMSYCFSKGGSVIGKSRIGGLLGGNGGINISYCYSTTNVSGEILEGYSGIGGLVGYSQSSTISDCYAAGNVQSYGGVASGLVGNLNSGNVTRCYSTGKVSGTGEIGGLIGGNNYGQGKVTDSFWDIQASGWTWSAGGMGKTTAQMQTKSTFTSAGWDFTTPIWTIDEGIYYPRLWWEKKILHVPAEYPTIQDAIDAAVNGDTVIIAPGTYTGDGNRDIDFLGKAITVRSTDPNDPNIIASTIIDCQANSGNRHRGVKFDSGEGANSLLSGVTIRNGFGPDEQFGPNKWSAGGGILCRGSSPTICDCVISSNRVYTSSVLCATGGGLYIRNGSPIVSNCKFYSNNAEHGGGIFVGFGGEPSIIGCTLSNNWTHFGGAGIFALTRLTIKDSTITSNSAGNYGGGVYCEHGPIEISNCIIAENSAQEFGGGFCGGYINATIANCTIVGNWSLVSGGGVDFYFYSGGTIENCILWDNSSPNGPAISMRYPHAPSHASVCYSDVEGGTKEVYVDTNCTLNWGEGNINADPCFIKPGYWANVNDPNIIVEPNDPNAVWVDGDYHLLPSSICIDVGDPNYIPEPNETDLDGNPRVNGGRIDMGAYESVMHEARLWIWPRVINRKSHQPRIMAWLRLPQGITKDQINRDVPLILYPGGIKAVRQFVFQNRRRGARRTSVFAFFNKAELMDTIDTNGTVQLMVLGHLLKPGQYFYGSDTVWIRSWRWRRRWPWHR